jgi:hypothetical protein
MGNLGLQLQNVAQVAVIALGPDLALVCDVDQLDGCAEAIARATHAATQEESDPQFGADAGRVLR